MLKKNQLTYSLLISRLPLAELTDLFERSKEYPSLGSAIAEEIDRRLTVNCDGRRSPLSRSTEQAEMQTASAA